MDRQIAVPLPDNLSTNQAEIFSSAYIHAYNDANIPDSGRRAQAAAAAWKVLRDAIENDGTLAIKERADTIPTPKKLNAEEADKWNSAYLQAIDGECRNADAPQVCAAKAAWEMLRGGTEKEEKSGNTTPAKAKKILRDGEIDGKPLTDKQKRFFGAIAGGEKPRRKSILDSVTNERAREYIARSLEYARLGYSVWAQEALSGASKYQPISQEIVDELSGILRAATAEKNAAIDKNHYELTSRRFFSSEKLGQAALEKRKSQVATPKNERLERPDLPDWFVKSAITRMDEAELDAQLLREHSGETIIERPDYIESEQWRSWPASQKTLRSELTRRAIRRNYFQAADDLRLDGWRAIALPGRAHTGEMEFRKYHASNQAGTPILMRAILVRKINSKTFYPKALGRFIEKSTATLLARDELRLS